MNILVQPPTDTRLVHLTGGPLDGSVIHLPAALSGEFSFRHAGGMVSYAAAEPLQGGGRNWRVIAPQKWTIRFQVAHPMATILEAVVTARRWCAALGKAEELLGSFCLPAIDLREPRLVDVTPLMTIPLSHEN